MLRKVQAQGFQVRKHVQHHETNQFIHATATLQLVLNIKLRLFHIMHLHCCKLGLSSGTEGLN